MKIYDEREKLTMVVVGKNQKSKDFIGYLCRPEDARWVKEWVESEKGCVENVSIQSADYKPKNANKYYIHIANMYIIDKYLKDKFLAEQNKKKETEEKIEEEKKEIIEIEIEERQKTNFRIYK